MGIIFRVISGGQTGVDIAALRAARRAGIQTGGWCPKGWLTGRGPQPGLLKRFGLRETSAVEYAVRTRANVRDSDATLIIADRPDAGTKLTASICRGLNRPMFFVPRSQVGDENPHALERKGRRIPASPGAKALGVKRLPRGHCARDGRLPAQRPGRRSHRRFSATAPPPHGIVLPMHRFAKDRPHVPRPGAMSAIAIASLFWPFSHTTTAAFKLRMGTKGSTARSLCIVARASFRRPTSASRLP
jgi:hypothetical protein